LLRESSHAWVDFDGWKRIDAEETARPGARRSRSKIRHFEGLMEIGARVDAGPVRERRDPASPSPLPDVGQRWNA
jgi:hypothetical protein